MRACFWLLAVVVCVVMAETLLALLGCLWVVISTGAGAGAPSACPQLGTQIREIMAELLTAILALIAASRGPPER